MDEQQEQMSQEEWNGIKQAIQESQPLIARREPLDGLEDQYRDNPGFMRNIRDAKEKYSGMRRIRGDGSCFYRSYFFASLEYFLTPPHSPSHQLVQRTLATQFYNSVQTSLDSLLTLGYERTAIEDFYDSTMSVVGWATQPAREGLIHIQPQSTFSSYTYVSPHILRLEDELNDPNVAPWVLMYLRLITSAHLQHAADDYLPYLPQPDIPVSAYPPTAFLDPTNPTADPMKTFCKAEVEPIDRDADNIQCMALTRALGLYVKIEYITPQEGTNAYILPDESGGAATAAVGAAAEKYQIVLLYRPGHYDILYEK